MWPFWLASMWGRMSRIRVKWLSTLMRKIFSRKASDVWRMVCAWAMPALLMRTVGVGVLEERRDVMVELIDSLEERSILWYVSWGTVTVLFTPNG